MSEIELNGSLTGTKSRRMKKSDNYGIKETTSIQTGRRGTNAERAGPTPTWTKTRVGYLRSKEYQTHTRPPAQDSSSRKVSPHNFWLQKPVGIELVEETSRAPSNSSKEPSHGLTYSGSLPLGPSTRVAAWKASGYTGRN